MNRSLFILICSSSGTNIVEIPPKKKKRNYFKRRSIDRNKNRPSNPSLQVVLLMWMNRFFLKLGTKGTRYKLFCELVKDVLKVYATMKPKKLPSFWAPSCVEANMADTHTHTQIMCSWKSTDE